MAKGFKYAKKTAGDGIAIVADCGTGTGFVTRQASEQFPGETFVAFDLLMSMLKIARKNCQNISNEVFHAQADSFKIPLADESVDLVLVQNTMPCFREFYRICRPGGMVLYVDSSSGWVVNWSKRLLKKQRLFETIEGERVDMGFWILARKAGKLETPGRRVEGDSKQERMAGLLRCSLDRTKLVLEGDSLCCARQHRFSIEDGFPVMLGENAMT